MSAFPRLPPRLAWALSLAVLMGLQSLLWGTPVPTGNEDHYLAVLQRVADPSFLASDWTFGPPLPDRWVFDTLFGLLARGVPLEVLGWAGRVVTWALSLAAMIRLASALGIRLPGATGALALFLVLGQSLVGGEWMLGWFEAKAVAWSLWLHALADALEERLNRGALLAGLAAVFHPAVGLVAAASLALAILATLRPLASLVRPFLLGTLAALPGLVQALVMGLRAGQAESADWEFLSRTFLRIHLDASTFDRTLLLAMVLGIAGLLWEVRRRPGRPAWTRLAWTLVLPGALFLVGLCAQGLGAWSWMSLTPYRLLPPLALLGCCLAWASLFQDDAPSRGLRTGLLVAAAVLLCLPPLPWTLRDRLAALRSSWTPAPDPWVETFEWVNRHAPEDALVLAPPWRGDSALRMRRAQVVHAAMPRYDRLAEWHRRIADLLGEDLPDPGNRDLGEVWRKARDRWSRLTPDHVAALASRYGASLLITDADLPLPTAFRSGSVAVYRLSPGSAGIRAKNKSCIACSKDLF